MSLRAPQSFVDIAFGSMTLRQCSWLIVGTLLIWFSKRTAMLSDQLVRSDENCPSTDRPMPTTAIPIRN